MALLFKRRTPGELPPPDGGFVDIHSHPLAGVDDGAESWDESIAIIERAAEGGTTVMVATPHGDRRGRWKDVEGLRAKCDELNEEARRRGIGLSVLLGMEAPLALDMVQRLAGGSSLTLNRTDCVLVEFPFAELPLYWEDALFQLQLAGKRPIIAHPERQARIQARPEMLRGPVDRGILVQVTAASLAGHMGQGAKKAADRLLKNGLAHIIASDTHAPEGPRGPDLLAGYNAAARLVGPEKAAEMASTFPRALVLGKPLPGSPA